MIYQVLTINPVRENDIDILGLKLTHDAELIFQKGSENVLAVSDDQGRTSYNLSLVDKPDERMFEVTINWSASEQDILSIQLNNETDFKLMKQWL